MAVRIGGPKRFAGIEIPMHAAMNKTKTLYGLLSLGAALALSACAASFKGSIAYPYTWAPLETGFASDGCPRLEGTYANHGTGTFPPELGKTPSLGNIFSRLIPEPVHPNAHANRRLLSALSAATSVSIVQSSEKLKVSFLGKNGKPIPLNFRRDHLSITKERHDGLFTCYHGDSEPGSKIRYLTTEPRLRLWSESEAGFELVVSGAKTLAAGNEPAYFDGVLIKVLLLTAEDDSLVIQWRSEPAFDLSLGAGSLNKTSIWWRYPLLRDVQ